MSETFEGVDSVDVHVDTKVVTIHGTVQRFSRHASARAQALAGTSASARRVSAVAPTDR